MPKVLVLSFGSFELPKPNQPERKHLRLGVFSFSIIENGEIMLSKVQSCENNGFASDSARWVCYTS